MPQQLLTIAREQAERSEGAVKAPAFLHIARVLARFDQFEAERALDTGIALGQDLPAKFRSIILREAVYLAATVSPKRALPLYAATERRDDPWGGNLVRLLHNMASHGHVDEAISYLNDPLPGDRFPIYFVNNLFAECSDDATRLKLLRSAIRAWRDPMRANFGPGDFGAGKDRQALPILFARSWKLLPHEEAVRTVREMVEWILQAPDGQPGRIPITGNPSDPEFTSELQYLLFRILPCLRRLDPELTESLLEQNREFAAAARRFPYGMESVQEEAEDHGVCEDSMAIGKSMGTPDDPPNCRIVPMAEALANDFEEAFREAFDRYEYDSDSADPNEAPKECWASTQEFRNILFKAGKHQGHAAVKHLDRIPDADLRLFAQIELCAALAGLRQIGRTAFYHIPKARRGRRK